MISRNNDNNFMSLNNTSRNEDGSLGQPSFTIGPNSNQLITTRPRENKMFTDRSVLDAGPTIATMPDSNLVINKSQFQDDLLDTSRFGDKSNILNQSPSPFTKDDTNNTHTPIKIFDKDSKKIAIKDILKSKLPWEKTVIKNSDSNRSTSKVWRANEELDALHMYDSRLLGNTINLKK